MVRRGVEKIYGGIVLREVMNIDRTLLWCWQYMKDTGDVFRVTATDAGVSVTRDGEPRSPYGETVWLDENVIFAINYAQEVYEDAFNSEGEGQILPHVGGGA